MECFTDVWDILGPFGTFCVHLVHFFRFWCIVSRKIWQPWNALVNPPPKFGTDCKHFREHALIRARGVRNVKILHTISHFIIFKLRSTTEQMPVLVFNCNKLLKNRKFCLLGKKIHSDYLNDFTFFYSRPRYAGVWPRVIFRGHEALQGQGRPGGPLQEV
jgi:hypothetical protein